MMVKKQTNLDPSRIVALCYIRQSYTRDDEDTNSPERQRANIERVVERNGWTAEWYEDVGGHKSGQTEKNRPGWLALKERLDDNDVVALIANDLSRLHRNVSSVSQLIEVLEKHNIALLLAASDISIDTSTLMGQMFAQFSSLMDAYYAKDISAKAKDSIAHRKRQGKVVGIPPFGLTRDDEGYLTPSNEGVWLMPDGTFQKGNAEKSPDDDALWRSYYECAQYILEIYGEGNVGLAKIAYRMNSEGWAFRDRWAQPRSMTRDDIRRVVSNWPEYGGMVVDKRGKDRPSYEAFELEAIPFVEERAVFPLNLLRKVAAVKNKRTIRPKDDGKKRQAFHYPLSVITLCAHCVRQSDLRNDPKLRTALRGKLDARGIRRYTHRAGVQCGCTNRSVPCDVVEEKFLELVNMMTINPDMVQYMTEFAIQADKARGVHSQADIDNKKRETIALCQRKIKAAVILYAEGRIDYDKYRSSIDKNEREIAYWKARTTESEKVAFELAKCIDAFNDLVRLWGIAEPEEKQKMARNMFENIVFDLDTRRLVGFKLKPWVDKYVGLRAAWNEDVRDVLSKQKTTDLEEFQVGGNAVPPRGLDGRPFPLILSQPERIQLLLDNIEFTDRYLQEKLYWKHEVINYTPHDPLGAKGKRNSQITQMYLDGVTLTTIASQFGLTAQRVHQIVQD